MEPESGIAGCAGKANYRLGIAVGLATQGWARLAWMLTAGAMDGFE